MSTIFLLFCSVNLCPRNTTIIGTVIFYGGIAQFIVGTYEIRKGITFCGTVFCSYEAYWLSIVLLYLTYIYFEQCLLYQNLLEIYFIFWYVFTGFIYFATLKLFFLILTLIITFLLLSFVEFTEFKVVARFGGGLAFLKMIRTLYYMYRSYRW